MEWTKVSIQTTSAGIEPLTGLVLSCGISGVEVVDPREFNVFLNQDKTAWDYVDESLMQIPTDDNAYVVFYLPVDSDGEGVLAQIKNRLVELSPSYKNSDSLANTGSFINTGSFVNRDSLTNMDSLTNTDSLTNMGSLTIKTERVDDALWLDEWKKYFAPIYIGRVAIVPAWERVETLPPEVDVVFTLDPGSAFGTGQHATTYLCVEALAENLRPGQTVLDAGCGSGILSVIGLLLGAGNVVACDIDPLAVSATWKNAERNPVDLTRLQVKHGNIITDMGMQKEILENKYDIVVANIVADVVILLVPLIPKLLKKGGCFIASGIIAERAEDVKTALKEYDISLKLEKVMDGWVCMVCGCA
jgi:ribosomal protein L11 methyltransferase